MAERNRLLGRVLISIIGLTVANAAASQVWNPRMDCKEKPEKVGNLTFCKDGDLIWISSDNGNPFPIEGKLQHVRNLGDLTIVGFEKANQNHIIFIQEGKITGHLKNTPSTEVVYKIKDEEVFFAIAEDRIIYTVVDIKTGKPRLVGELEVGDK